MTEHYTNRELDAFFGDIKNQLDRIEAQTTKTNGTVRLHTRILLVGGSVLGTLLIMNGSELVGFVLSII